jgi:hypothetical protein
MKPISALFAACLATWLPSLQAYPPAPPHIFYGCVRDEMGNPLNSSSAEVILEALSGTQVKTKINPSLQSGVNYSLSVPMDSGITDDLYQATALRPMVPFRIKVKIGQTTYLPIETKGDYANLGRPGQRTRLDLTLGEDSDGDGLPDAWERALVAALGGNLDLQDINPKGDSDGDGLSNVDEYLAGTYAFDNKDGFALKIVRSLEDRAVLEFMAIRGRAYTLYGSEDLKDWKPISFRMVANDPNSPAVLSYYATDARVWQVETVPQPEQPSMRYFKLLAQ